jgi:hypothetical protein
VTLLLCLQGGRWNADGVWRCGDCPHLEGEQQRNMQRSNEVTPALEQRNQQQQQLQQLQ